MILITKNLEGFKSRHPIELECEHCGKHFFRPKNQVQAVIAGNGKIKLKYCSRSCGRQYNTKLSQQPNAKCSWCGKMFYRVQSKLKPERSRCGLFFCCTEHKNEAQKCGKIVKGNFRGGKSSYREFAMRETKHCEKCGFTHENLSVLEVHHKDRNRLNNSKSNLIVLCKNCHFLEHANDRKKWFKKGMDKTNKKYGRHPNHAYAIEWPPMEELKKMVLETSYVKVSKKLGVSDTAIKKHIWNEFPDFSVSRLKKLNKNK